MTDKLIEHIRRMDEKGVVLDPLEARILADARIIKAAEELAQSLSGDIVYMPNVHDKVEAFNAAVSEAQMPVGDSDAGT